MSDTFGHGSAGQPTFNIWNVGYGLKGMTPGAKEVWSRRLNKQDREQAKKVINEQMKEMGWTKGDEQLAYEEDHNRWREVKQQLDNISFQYLEARSGLAAQFIKRLPKGYSMCFRCGSVYLVKRGGAYWTCCYDC